MKKFRIRAWHSYTSNPETKEKNTDPSQTQPGMHLTPREIITRYSRGSHLGGVPKFTPIWNGELEMPDLSRLTIQDRMDYLETVKEFIKTKRSELATFKKRAEEAVLEPDELEQITPPAEPESGESTK
jgi:hypothetical protein